MQSKYKKLGQYIQQVSIKNRDLKVTTLLGVSITKKFIPSIANTIGTDMSKYKIVKKNQFTYGSITSRNGDKISIALLEDEEAIVSTSYTVFKVIDEDELLPEYLMMWFRRAEFDRYARFMSHGSTREAFGWAEMCEVEIPVPSIEKQSAIVKEYKTITDRIALNEKTNQKLEETAQAIYKNWFVDFEFPNAEGKPYKSSGGEMIFCDELDGEIPFGWDMSTLSNIANILMGQSPSGDSYNQNGNGEIFYQGRTEFSFRFPMVRTYTTEPKRMANKYDILMSVRAPVGDINIASESCCIGRGVAALSSKIKCNSFLYYLMQDIKQIFDVSNDGGTVFGSITKVDLYNIRILKPNNDLTLRFDSLVQNIDKKIKYTCKELSLLRDVRVVLLSKMAIIKDCA